MHQLEIRRAGLNSSSAVYNQGDGGGASTPVQAPSPHLQRAGVGQKIYKTSNPRDGRRMGSGL